jgi:hypothetical protein
MNEPITYRKLPTWKYQLVKNWETETNVKGFLVEGPLFVLYPLGTLKVYRGYAWDGPSGPTIDTKSFMRASVVHDVLYQCIREGNLPESFRKLADEELVRYAKMDGMSAARRFYVYWSLRAFAGRAARLAKQAGKIYQAP